MIEEDRRNLGDLSGNSFPREVRGPQSMEALQGLNRMLAKKERLGGILEGCHGTAASIGRQIQEGGFANYKSVDGSVGVWFHDDSVAQNANLHGRDKARELGEDEFCLIKARLTNPTPDLEQGRPQWLAQADKIEILEITFHKTDGH